ncbi:unnamed protein product [Caenorhabditis bovis]|uniref:Uncharacterized protein n=1 Tax=Caenorhabditis bovis TaxID=2654633 RepID=A0A8S1EWC5_9PELO|nr:unnamed protein product [Caenorhabditis bovis]
MYTLTVMNMSAAEVVGWTHYFQIALIVEFILLIINFLQTLFMWYLVHFTNQYHRNLALLVEQICNQYFVSVLSRMFIIYMQITELRMDILLQNEYFLFAIWLRNSLLFVAFYCAPFLVFERVFATYYMADYENNQRRWIAYILIFLLYTISFTSAQLFIFVPSTDAFHTILISCTNLFAFALTILTDRYNRLQYRALRRSLTCCYSLSSRVQLAENIKSSRPFKVLCLLIAVFAFISSSMLHVDRYTNNETIRNVVYLVFNYSCWSYGTFVPIFMLFYNKKWQEEVIRLKRIVVFRNHHQIPLQRISKNEVKDSFGRNCLVDGKQQTDVYFSQLKFDWK